MQGCPAFWKRVTFSGGDKLSLTLQSAPAFRDSLLNVPDARHWLLLLLSFHIGIWGFLSRVQRSLGYTVVYARKNVVSAGFMTFPPFRDSGIKENSLPTLRA